MRDRIFTALVLVAFLGAVVLSVSCAGPAVIESSRSCSDIGLDNALAEACERWPASCEIGQRMDFYCVSQEAVEAVTRCGWMRPDTAIIDHCTMWLGTSPAYRGRVYAGPRDPIAAVAYHEAQHWQLLDEDPENDCQTHTADCGWKD